MGAMLCSDRAVEVVGAGPARPRFFAREEERRPSDTSGPPDSHERRERHDWGPGIKWSRGSSAGLPGDGEETLRRRTEEGQRWLRGPLDRGRGRIAPSGGAADAVGTCGLGERRAALCPSGGGKVLPGWTVRAAMGLLDPNFSPAKKSGGPQTSRTL
ncbi:hypothetical protein NDU88_003211 [Pleurodeles waltl]|uniref:Uncharacterized protein n=1 Tax=Pleurodeles waltl TaxID=8319 RepID=A0AAV7LER8_PLEWA|nr:hypothetical protein NDU88_003211 [Pleurodeles waltl]